MVLLENICKFCMTWYYATYADLLIDFSCPASHIDEFAL